MSLYVQLQYDEHKKNLLEVIIKMTYYQVFEQ